MQIWPAGEYGCGIPAVDQSKCCPAGEFGCGTPSTDQSCIRLAGAFGCGTPNADRRRFREWFMGLAELGVVYRKRVQQFPSAFGILTLALLSAPPCRSSLRASRDPP